MTAFATLADIIFNTPYWVWLILAVLVWRGLSRTRPREVSVGGLTLMPIVLAGLSLHNLLADGFSNAVLAGTGIGGIIGVTAGFISKASSCRRSWKMVACSFLASGPC